jgi:Fe-S cluster biogenesis protein NfuA
MAKNTTKTIKERVEEALQEVNPYLQNDGGGVELVEISEDGKVVKVKLTGACGCCPHAFYTLKMGVEQIVKEKVPEVESVEAIFS